MEDKPFLSNGDFIYAQKFMDFKSTNFNTTFDYLYPNFELKTNTGLKVYFDNNINSVIKYKEPNHVKIIDNVKKTHYKLNDLLDITVKKINNIKLKKIKICIKNTQGIKEDLFEIENEEAVFDENLKPISTYNVH